MSDSTLSLQEFIEPAPFIDIALDDDASVDKRTVLEPLSLGAEHGIQLERLHPALLRAHIALARLLEASQSLDPQEPPLKFILLRDIHASLQRSGTSIDIDKLLSVHDESEKDSEGVASILQAVPGLTRRTIDQGFNRQRLVEIASAFGSRESTSSVNAGSPEGFTDPGTGSINRRTGCMELDEGQFITLLENWHEFTEMSHRDLDTLVVSAIAFTRFWQLKPLSSNNAIAAYLMWQLLLVDAGICKFPALALCEQIVMKGEEHDHVLTRAIVKNDAQAREDWVLYSIDLIEQAALLSLTRIHKCRTLFQSMQQSITDAVAGQHGNALYELLRRHPVIKIKHVVDADIAKRQTASIYLNKLVDCGLLQSRQSGRSKSFYNHAYLEIFGWNDKQ